MFLDHVRHQMRLSQALRHREQSLEGGMLIEKVWPGEPSLEDMASYMLVGDAATIAERMAAEIRAAGISHYLLQFQAGGTSLALALRSIERCASEVRPMLERQFGPLERVNVAQAA